jgi:hypothetical protein
MWAISDKRGPSQYLEIKPGHTLPSKAVSDIMGHTRGFGFPSMAATKEMIIRADTDGLPQTAFPFHGKSPL